LILLNKQDVFLVFDEDCFERDEVLELQLNANEKGFKRAFSAFGNLYAVDANNQAFMFVQETAEWVEENNLPFFNRTPIFENETYLAYYVVDADSGAFIGNLFFYNKHTKRTTFTPIYELWSLKMQPSGEFYTVAGQYNSWRDVYNTNIRKFDSPDLLFKLPDDFTLHHKGLTIDEIARYLGNIMKADTTISPAQYAKLTDNFRININDMTVHFPDWLFQSWGQYWNHYRNDKDRYVWGGYFIGDEYYFSISDWIKAENRAQSNFAKLQNDSLVIVDSTIDDTFPFSLRGEQRWINNKIVIDAVDYGNKEAYDIELVDESLLKSTIIISDSTLIRLNWLR
jgi:hypothetical protein